MHMWFTILSLLSSMQLIAGFPCWDSDHCVEENGEMCDEELLTKGTVTWDQYLGTATKGTNPKKLKVSLQQTAGDYCKMENGPWLYESSCELYGEKDSTPTVFVAKECPKDTVCAQGRCVEPTKCEDPDNDFAYSKNAQYFAKNSVTETKGVGPTGPPIPDKCNPAPDHPELLAEKICVAVPGGAKLDTEYVDCAQWNATCENGACVCATADCTLPCVDYIGPTELLKFNPFKSGPEANDCSLLWQDPEGTPQFSALPHWIGNKAQAGKLFNGPTDADNDDIHDTIELCKTLTDALKKDTDSDGRNDGFHSITVDAYDKMIWNAELDWQAISIRAFDGHFHPEHGETNPLKADTDGDGLSDPTDPCPLNAVATCHLDACTKADPPPWTCTVTVQYEEDLPEFPKKYGGGLNPIRTLWTPNSLLVLVDFSQVVDSAKNYSDPGDIHMYRSTDDGATWTKQWTFSLSAVFGNNTTQPLAHLSSDTTGTHIRGAAFGVPLWSDDGGDTWSISTKQYVEKGWHISPDGEWEYIVTKDGLKRHQPGTETPWEKVVDAPDVVLDMATNFDGSTVWMTSGTVQGIMRVRVNQTPPAQDWFPIGEVATSPSGTVIMTRSTTGVKVTPNYTPLYHTPIVFSDNEFTIKEGTDAPAATIPPGGIPQTPHLAGNGTTAMVITKEGGLWVSTKAMSVKGTGDIWQPVTLANCSALPLCTSYSYALPSASIAIRPDGGSFIGVRLLEKKIQFTKITCP